MCAGWTRRGFCLGLVLAGAARARAADLPRMVVTKDPSCGCCRAWTEHVRAAGFPIEVVESASVGRLKARLGVPQDLAGCHTAEVGGYVVEGHVPAAAIRRLLEERPAATGACGPRHASRLAGHGSGGLVRQRSTRSCCSDRRDGSFSRAIGPPRNSKGRRMRAGNSSTKQAAG